MDMWGFCRGYKYTIQINLSGTSNPRSKAGIEQHSFKKKKKKMGFILKKKKILP